MNMDLTSLKARLAELDAWRKANIGKVGSLEFSKTTIEHALINSLVRAGGGNDAARNYVTEQLKLVEDGTHPELAGLK